MQFDEKRSDKNILVLVTSVKEVMFFAGFRLFVCLFVCLSVCLLAR